MTAPRATYSAAELREFLDRLPRFPLAHLPTPLEFLPRLSEALGGPRIWIKRDDCTGLALGGNKARHHELLIADALLQGADTIVWGAGLQSNNCRQIAAACAKAGLVCHLVLGRGKPAAGPDPIQGNLLLDHLLGASVEIVDEAEGPAVDEKITQAAGRLKRLGRRVYERIPKIVKPLAALGYVAATLELFEQAEKLQLAIDAIYICSSGATGAGISLATTALGNPVFVQHITPIVWPWNTQQEMARLASAAAERLGIATRLETAEINVTEEYVGAAYGVPTPECLEAISLLARNEGILLDPSYTGKSMAGLIDHIRQGRYKREQNVVFVHTGGLPALFAYNDQLAHDIPRQRLLP